MTKTLETASGIRREEDDDFDPRLVRSLGGCERFVEAQIVELTNRCVAGLPHLAKRVAVLRADMSRGQSPSQIQHGLPPGPEVATLGAAAKGALKAVRMRIDEARQRDRLCHAAIILVQMVTRAVQSPLAQLPNALTVLRLGMIPLYVALMLSAENGKSWPAALVFGAAGATDQIDGWLARRWRVESTFGKIADPLADRLMIDAAVVMLWVAGRLPLVALGLVLARDILLVGGYKLLVPHGYDFEVNTLGKLATWLLYAALALLMVTSDGTAWPLWLFWTGIAVALAAGVQYLVKARREVAR